MPQYDLEQKVIFTLMGFLTIIMASAIVLFLIGLYLSVGLLGLIGLFVGVPLLAFIGYFIGKWIWERV